MACGSYSEKLHVILISHLELLASYLRAWNALYLLESAVSCVVYISAASVCDQAFIRLAVGAASSSHAGVGRYKKQLSSAATWGNWNMTQANGLGFLAASSVCWGIMGHLLSFWNVPDGEVVFPVVKSCLKPRRLILDPGMCHWNTDAP